MLKITKTTRFAPSSKVVFGIPRAIWNRSITHPFSPAPAQPPLRHSLTRVVCVPMGPLPEDSVTIRAGRSWEGPARTHMRPQPRAGCTSPKHRVYPSEKFRGGIPSFTGAASPSIPTMQHHSFFIRNVHSASRSVHHILQRRLGRPKTVLKNNTLQPQTSSEHGEFRVPLPLRHANGST